MWNGCRVFYGVNFAFFGVRCRILVPTRDDAEHLAFYFRSHLTEPGAAAFELLLSVSQPGLGFIPQLVDSSSLKEIFIRSPGNPWSLYDRFRVRSACPSPIPPFSLPPLATRLQLLHAAALTCPTGKAILLAGHSVLRAFRALQCRSVPF
jgi:hypothetical protein